jgi:hypothetical protein
MPLAQQVSSATQLQQQNKWLLVFSAVNLAGGIWFQSRLGAFGIVLANCLTMGLRIAYSSHLIHAEFRCASDCLRTRRHSFRYAFHTDPSLMRAHRCRHIPNTIPFDGWLPPISVMCVLAITVAATLVSGWLFHRYVRPTWALHCDVR